MGDTTLRGGQRLATRLAIPLLWMHAVAVVFATIALVTIVLAPVPPAFLSTPRAAAVYPVAFRISGPLYVVLGAATALAFTAGRIGWRRALGLLTVGAGISLGAELLGTSTGVPFGHYSYTAMLGYRIAGLVPYAIPLSWFYMLVGCLTICARALPARDDLRGRLGWAMMGGALLVAWDVSLDPAMSYATNHWLWHQPGSFYGMPWINFLGWFLTGTAVSLAMLQIVRPTAWRVTMAPSRLPLALYAVNGVMPIAMVVRKEMWGAAIAGTVAMLVPVIIGLRSADFGARGRVGSPDSAPGTGRMATAGD